MSGVYQNKIASREYEYTRLVCVVVAPDISTQTQINSLTKDIITFEVTNVDGYQVLAPKIYLSQNTKDRLLNPDSITGAVSLAGSSTIFGKDSLTIDAVNSDLTNNGSIFSAGNVSLNLASLTNKTISNNSAQIISGNNLTITANIGNIKNIGANIGSVGNLTLTALQGNIINSALIQTNDAGLLNSSFGQLSGGDSYQMALGDTARTSGNITSTLLHSANIRGGNISIDSANDFINLAAKIESAKNTLADSTVSSGNLAIIAGNDVDIETLQLRNRTESTWGSKKHGGTSITDTLTNIGSDISSANNLSITSTGLSDNATTASINIIGSNVSATGNGSLTSDFGNINIANAVDSKMKENTSFKKGSFSSRYDSVYDYQETAVESKLNFGGDLVINAEFGNLNLIGSVLKTTGDLNIGSFTIAQNPDNSYKTNPDGTFQTIDGGSVAGVNIKAAELRSEHSETHTKTKLNLGDVLQLAANPIDQAKIAIDVAKFLYTPSLHNANLKIEKGLKFEKNYAKSSTATTTQHSATLDVGGDLMINSTDDVNIVASNVAVVGNALLNVDGNINISSAVEKITSSTKTESIEIGAINIGRDFSHASLSAGVEGSGTRFEESITTSTQKSSNINIGGSLLANVTNNLAVPNSGNLTLTASNLTVGGDSIIRTANDFILADAQDTLSYSSKESTLTIEVGAKAGNAYVDAAYAWKAVVDAQRKAIQAAEKLKKMERLQDEGKATAKAVELAAAQLVLAQTAVVTATIAASAASAGAASAASTSFGTGFYGAGYTNITASGIRNTLDTSTSVGSSFVVNGDVDIASNNNVNILGSLLASVNGSIILNAGNDIKVEAGTNTISQTSKQETIYDGGSVGNNGVQVNIGLSNGESNYNKTFYTNSIISAENGNLTLTTGNDANISGANLLAKNTILNIGNNLNIESKQTEEDSSSSGFGFSLAGGVSTNGFGGSGKGWNYGGGVSFSQGEMHRLWVDDITTIKGTDSMAVNVGKDLNLTGAAILSDNLVLAVTGNINKKELQDSYYSESMSLGVSTSIAVGGNQATVPGTGGKPNQSPGGSTSINANYSQNESNRTTYATIGGLDSKLTSETQDLIGGDFEGGITLDHRLFSQDGRAQIQDQLNQSIDLAVLGANKIIEQTKNLYNEIGVLLTPDEKNQIDQALINGNVQKAQELLNQFSKGKDLTDLQIEKLTNLFEGRTTGNEFLASLTAEDKKAILLTDQNGSPTSVGVFFDGTGNDAGVDALNLTDPDKNIETNVFRLTKSYNGLIEYVNGVGTSGGLDTICQGFGCGADKKQNQISDKIYENYYNPENPKLLVLDSIGFSRGGATAIDYVNDLKTIGILDNQGNQLIPSEYFISRSIILFDTVASFGLPGNGIDPGKNLSFLVDSFVIHATAENETRNLFDLQSIRFSDGNSANPNWIEQSFPGNHSDIGGSYAQGSQGKQNDIQFYTLNWMVNQANANVPSLNEGEKIFNTPAINQQPSANLTDLMNSYLEANQNNDQSMSDAIKSIINQNYIHQENFGLTTPWNYNIGNERGVFYQNNNLLNK